MANTTVRGAVQIHSTNPQFLVEKVIRSRIYDNVYWKEQCFALTAETIVDKAVALKYIGGTHGPQIPSHFLCLLLKLLQLQPEKEIIHEYLAAKDFKYLRALAAMYVRMTFPAMEVYETLEPMLEDYRKLRYRHQSGAYTLTHMDEFVDELLTQERVCELILPRITKREVLEETEGLAPRISRLEDAILQTSGEARAEGSDDEASDDSLRERRQEQRRRVQRAAEIRARREAEELARAQRALGTAGAYSEAMDVNVNVKEADSDYQSQEDTEDEQDARFVSRSPSRSISPDRMAASGDENGYRSRSGSRSPDRSPAPSYRSRSGSRSPDR